ncbi:hypothetical protein U879_14210 [Defluviimonas sp. 20V17]|nr:hypothetical protein U879_14210 [Defluviimonas sp. 20V17]
MLLVIYVVLSCSGLVLRPSYADALALPRGAALALAILLLFGRRRWPIVLLGAILARLIVSAASGAGLDAVPIASAIAIALLTTLQAVAGEAILRRCFGTPINIQGRAHLLRGFLLVGPALGIMTASAGIAIFGLFGQITLSGLIGNWLAWWVGDSIAILTVTTLIMLWPGQAPSPIRWQGDPLPRLQRASLAYVLGSFAITLAAWQVMTALMVHDQRNQFDTRVRDLRHVVERRLSAYALGLAGAAQLFKAQGQVSAAQWQGYLHAIDLSKRLPGLGGIGFAVPAGGGVGADRTTGATVDAAPAAAAKHPGGATIAIRQFASGAAYPGLPRAGIALVPAWRAAAEAARDSGEIRLSGPGPSSSSSSSAQAGAGVSQALLFAPVYRPAPDAGGRPGAARDRRGTFLGWVFAPVVYAKLLSSAASAGSRDLRVALYDGAATGPDSLVNAEPGDGRRPIYRDVSRISAFGRTWTLASHSTAAFENTANRIGPSSILAAGVAFTTMLTIYLLSLGRREDRISQEVRARTRELAARIEENRSIIQTPNANIALLDGAGTILFANESFKKLFAAPGDILTGRPLPDLLGGAVRDHFDSTRQQQSPADFRAEVRATRTGGMALVLDVQINTWNTADGLRRHTCLITDVSDKRRVEQALLEARNRLDLALTGAKIGVLEFDLATDTAVASPTWMRICGFDPAAQIDPRAEFMRHLRPEDRAKLEASDRACIEGRTERSICEVRFRRAEGDWRWIRSESVAGARDAEGRAASLISAMTDVTELEQHREALRQSEERFRSAFEAAPVGMAIIAPDGRFLKVNDALTRMVGIQASMADSQPFHHFLHPDDRRRVRGMVASVLEGRRESFETELRALHANGSAIWGKLSLAAVRNHEGAPATFVIQVHDLTDQRRAERMKNEFIATVSHELRTPLTSISGSLDLVANGAAGTMPEKAQSMLSIARRNCRRLILLVNDILDMEKLASRKMTFDLAEASIPTLVHQAVANTRPLAAQAQVDFTLAAPDEDLIGRVDANRFQQVLTNLLSNAVKFSESGGSVEIATRRQGSMACVSVTDHGPGVPDSFRAKIFTAFSQADSSATRAKGGTGLGLSISRQIVEEMGGEIDFTSDPGTATTFWFTVPLVASPAS